ncbi:MAG: helix-turn-helix domain-containing protein, partial [Blastocatellia bacterium]|nr:helix-turn-helix domain-containing protein [Blastocatellia bacterium]
NEILAPENKQPQIHPLLQKAQEDALRSQLTELEEQIKEYQELKTGKTKLEIKSLEDLPNLLIKARIAAGLTQKDLATRLGLKEQQIQRYEATEFASMNFSKLIQIIKIIGLTVPEQLLFSLDKIGHQQNNTNLTA